VKLENQTSTLNIYLCHQHQLKQCFKQTVNKFNITKVISSNAPFAYQQHDNLPGRTAILSFNQWTARVINTAPDHRGHST
jgi:hypothetical protein